MEEGAYAEIGELLASWAARALLLAVIYITACAAS